MTSQTRKLCILAAIFLLLMIPVFFLCRMVFQNKALTPELTVPETTETTQTLPPETLPPETVPVVTEPPRTEPPETVPETTVPKRPSIDAVPQYYQDDYPDTLYANGTMATSGSSMTALAMVATYLTDHAYYPDQMADYLAHFLGGNYQRLEFGCDLLQLSWQRMGNIHETIAEIKNGKIAIVMFSSNNRFTWKEHYVVVTGMTEDGKYIIMDTNRAHADNTGLATRYETGFEEEFLYRGYSCGWIFDKSQMPEDPFVYEPEPAPPESRYPGLVLTQEEKNLMAKLICMEAASEPFEGQQAVAEVILNRLASGRFQNSIHNIIYADGQFASVDYLYKAEPNYCQYTAIERALNGPYVLPIDVVFYAKFKMNDNYWGQIGAHYFCYKY